MPYPDDIPKDNNAALGLFLITIEVLDDDHLEMEKLERE